MSDPYRISFHQRISRFQVCWQILRGRSVAFRLDINGDVSGYNGPSLFAQCRVAGEPMRLEHVWLVNPAGEDEEVG
jgi:hypothetical protein